MVNGHYSSRCTHCCRLQTDCMKHRELALKKEEEKKLIVIVACSLGFFFSLKTYDRYVFFLLFLVFTTTEEQTYESESNDSK